MMKRQFTDRHLIIIFTGGPGTGKSGTANRFYDYLNDDEIVKLSYDEIKEKNWDRFGFDNSEQKYRINEWGLEELYLTIQHNMWAGKTMIVEYPFYQKHKPRLEELIKNFHYLAVTIYLYTDKRTQYYRSIARDGKESRHPGHFLDCYHVETYRPEMLKKSIDLVPSYEQFVSAISYKVYDLALGLSISIDVTDFSGIDYGALYEKILKYERESAESRKNI